MTGGAVAAGPFHHEAFLYRGAEQFLDVTARFVAEGVKSGEAVQVVVNATKIDALRARLGYLADAVEFADMAVVGANPARILAAWEDFVRCGSAAQRRLRGVGEPVDPQRSPAALTECHRHEALLNLAFADTAAWTLLCPYDVDALPAGVIDEARRNHPICGGGASAQYLGLDRIRAPFDAPLPPPVGPVTEVAFDDESALAAMRIHVAVFAGAAGMTEIRAGDLVLAVAEVATNSVRHGGGAGALRMWLDEGSVICEVRDRGRIENPLAGRRRPGADGHCGRGLWIVNQLCDLAQFRTIEGGTVARLHMSLR